MVSLDDLVGSTWCHHFVGRPYLLAGHIDLDLDPRLSDIQWVVVMDDLRFVDILDLDLDAHQVVLLHLVELEPELEPLLLDLPLAFVHSLPPSCEPSILFGFP
jgi:hypothetical protein